MSSSSVTVHGHIVHPYEPYLEFIQTKEFAFICTGVLAVVLYTLISRCFHHQASKKITKACNEEQAREFVQKNLKGVLVSNGTGACIEQRDSYLVPTALDFSCEALPLCADLLTQLKMWGYSLQLGHEQSRLNEHMESTTVYVQVPKSAI